MCVYICPLICKDGRLSIFVRILSRVTPSVNQLWLNMLRCKYVRLIRLDIVFVVACVLRFNKSVAMINTCIRLNYYARTADVSHDAFTEPAGCKCQRKLYYNYVLK